MVLQEEEDRLVNVLNEFMDGREDAAVAKSAAEQLRRFLLDVNVQENCTRFLDDLKDKKRTEEERRVFLYKDIAGIRMALSHRRKVQPG